MGVNGHHGVGRRLTETIGIDQTEDLPYWRKSRDCLEKEEIILGTTPSGSRAQGRLQITPTDNIQAWTKNVSIVQLFLKDTTNRSKQMGQNCSRFWNGCLWGRGAENSLLQDT